MQGEISANTGVILTMHIGTCRGGHWPSVTGRITNSPESHVETHSVPPGRPGGPCAGWVMMQNPRFAFANRGLLVLSLIAQEEQSQGAGAGVGTDHRAGVVNEYIFHTVFFLQQVCQVVCVLLAVTMADKGSIVSAGNTGGAQLFCQFVDGGFAAPCFGHIDQVALRHPRA